MNSRNVLFLATALGALALICGCQPPDMSAMQPPDRPTELDKLNMFVGSWRGETEMHMPGSDETMHTVGHSQSQWAADGWVLLEKYSAEIGEDHEINGVGVWWWDPQARKYRMWWHDDSGTVSTGTATYDENTHTWKMHGKSKSLYKHYSTIHKGTITMLDEDTMQWEHAEYGPLGLKKYFELSGTSHRK